MPLLFIISPHSYIYSTTEQALTIHLIFLAHMEKFVRLLPIRPLIVCYHICGYQILCNLCIMLYHVFSIIGRTRLPGPPYTLFKFKAWKLFSRALYSNQQIHVKWLSRQHSGPNPGRGTSSRTLEAMCIYWVQRSIRSQHQTSTAVTTSDILLPELPSSEGTKTLSDNRP